MRRRKAGSVAVDDIRFVATTSSRRKGMAIFLAGGRA